MFSGKWLTGKYFTGKKKKIFFFRKMFYGFEIRKTFYRKMAWFFVDQENIFRWPLIFHETNIRKSEKHFLVSHFQWNKRTHSVKSFSEIVQNCESLSVSFLNSVWVGIVPPKVELFCWQVLRERVVVKMELVKRNLLSSERSLCTFFNIVFESVNHLFLHCQVAWKLWTTCYQWWGI